VWHHALRGPEALCVGILAAAIIAADSASAQDKKDLQQIERDLNDAKSAAKSLEERGRALQTELDILNVESDSIFSCEASKGAWALPWAFPHRIVLSTLALPPPR